MILYELPSALPHILVAEDDDASGEVSKDTNNEEESVEYGDGNQSLHVYLVSTYKHGCIVDIVFIQLSISLIRVLVRIFTKWTIQ